MTSQGSPLSGERVSRETQDRLNHFLSLFLKWSATINLVAPSTVGELRQRHIADSLQISDLFSGPKTWIDLGSGGGFPGIITAIVLAEHGGGWVHLVESNKKKAAFLRVALQETAARGSVHAIRIEEAPAVIPDCDAISARALAGLADLLTFIEPWTQRRTDLRAFLHKGRDYQTEIDNARGRFRFDLVKHQSRIEADSVVLEISGLKRVNDRGTMHEPR